MNVQSVTVGAELDIKRFYLPGISIVSRCPKCNKEYSKDFSDTKDGHYLSFPNVNVPMEYFMYCDECDHDWPVMVTLKIELITH